MQGENTSLPEEIITTQAFRGYLAMYPHRENLSAMLSGTEMAHTHLTGGDYNPPNTRISLDLDTCILTYCDFEPGARLRGMSARDTEWSNIQMPRVDLSQANMTGSHFSNMHMEDATLVHTILARTIFHTGHSWRANMESLSAVGSEWYHWNFHESNLIGADFTNSRFEYCTFTMCQLTNVSFRNCTFVRCQFVPYVESSNADFTGAKDLRGKSYFPPQTYCFGGVKPRELNF